MATRVMFSIIFSLCVCVSEQKRAIYNKFFFCASSRYCKRLKSVCGAQERRKYLCRNRVKAREWRKKFKSIYMQITFFRSFGFFFLIKTYQFWLFVTLLRKWFEVGGWCGSWVWCIYMEESYKKIPEVMNEREWRAQRYDTRAKKNWKRFVDNHFAQRGLSLINLYGSFSITCDEMYWDILYVDP